MQMCVWCAFWYGLVGNVFPMRYSLIFLSLDLIIMTQMYCHVVTLVLVLVERVYHVHFPHILMHA